MIVSGGIRPPGHVDFFGKRRLDVCFATQHFRTNRTDGVVAHLRKALSDNPVNLILIGNHPFPCV